MSFSIAAVAIEVGKAGGFASKLNDVVEPFDIAFGALAIFIGVDGGAVLSGMRVTADDRVPLSWADYVLGARLGMSVE